jgi:hypothetical protein
MRTLVVWLGLIVLFVALYQLFAGTTGAQFTSTYWPVICLGVFLVSFLARLLPQRAAMKTNNEAHSQLAEGRVLEALAGFESARPRMRNPLPLYNIGWAQLLLWRVADAAVTLELFVKKSGGLNGVPAGDKLAGPPAALAHALLGHTADARRWIEKAPGTPTAKLAGIVLAARAQDFAEASRLFQSSEVVLDQLGGIMRAFAETLSAYIASKTGGRGGTVDPVRMFRESSVDALKPVWPELYDFVVRASQGPVTP